jgi:hypothetical protein
VPGGWAACWTPPRTRSYRYTRVDVPVDKDFFRLYRLHPLGRPSSPTPSLKPKGAIRCTLASPPAATVLGEPHDALDMHRYSARDLEGNLRSFGTDRP